MSQRPPNKVEARVGSAGLKEVQKGIDEPFPDSTTKESRQGVSEGAPPLDHNSLLAQFERAERRLNRGTYLLGHALDLRERLWWGLDLDAMTAEVDQFRRACMAWRSPYEESAT